MFRGEDFPWKNPYSRSPAERGVENVWSWNRPNMFLDITRDYWGIVGSFPDDPRSFKSIFMNIDFHENIENYCDFIEIIEIYWKSLKFIEIYWNSMKFIEIH